MLRSNSKRINIKTDTLSVPQIQVMSPVSPTSTRRMSRDTGFPEPFHLGSNTTLPHPEADLSPDASISHDDEALTRVLKRHRLSFRNKHKHTISHGHISPQFEALQSILSLVDIDTSKVNGDGENTRTRSPPNSVNRLSKDEGASIGSKRYDDTPPTSPSVSERSTKRGLFRRWRDK